MKKIIRKEFHIIETYSEIEVTDEELIRLSLLDEDEYNDEMFELFENNFRINVSTKDRFDIESIKFNIPEQSESLGYIDIIDGCIIENDLYNVISILRNDYEMELINNKTLKTFYWDYSDLDRQEDLKSYIRDQKINNILK